MTDLSNAHLQEIIIHRIKKEEEQESLIISDFPVPIKDEGLKDLLVRHFLFPFSKDRPFYNFSGSDDNTNEVFGKVSSIFESGEIIKEASVALAELLFEKSRGPRIKDGEFFIARFGGCIVDGSETDAIGLFKSESKETYLKITASEESLGIGSDIGININKLDKACLIFNTEKTEGYRVCIIDNSSAAGDEARYWKEEFLNLKPREDDFHRTRSLMNLCKDFCEEVLTEDNKIEKKDQLMMKNRSLDYFKKKEVFNAGDFAREVIAEPKVIEVFNEYKQNFFKKHDIQDFEEFEISPAAVKNSKGIFKSVLKLDKNFHVYVHGRHDFIEKGFDEDKNMSYYRLFFKEEQ